ncbi:hypothetical protein ACLMJK_005635 [Lecanora helva]
MDSTQFESGELYWGSYHYLYGSLTADEAQSLENAIFARRLGRYREALEIWNEKLPLPHTVPVLAIEKAELECRLLRHKSRLDILEAFLASETGWRQVPTEEEMNLLKILAAGAKVEATGSLHPAFLEARSQKRFWQGRNVEDLSLTESTLLRANYFFGCIALSPPSKEFLGKDVDTSHVSEFADIIRARLSTESEIIMLALINTRLQLAQNLLDLERVDELSEQLHQIESALKTSSWIRESDAPVSWFRSLQVNAKVPRDMNHLSSWLELASVMRQNEDALQETSVLLDIHLILHAIDGLKRDSNWIAVNDANLGRFDEMNSELGGSALIVGTSLSRFGEFNDSTSTAGDYLHRFQLFNNHFPEFDVPFHLLFMYHSACDAARKLGNGDLRHEFERKESSVWASCPASLAAQNWHYRGKDPSNWPDDFLIIILEWMKIDYETGRLSTIKVADLLILSQKIDLHEEIRTVLDTVASRSIYAKVLADRIYGFGSPVDGSAWKSHFEKYENWLWNSPAEVERSIRHTILLDMQQARNIRLLHYHSKKNNPKDLLNHDLQFDLHMLREAEWSRLAGLRKRIDKGAVGASEMAILSDEWHCMSLKNGLASSVKAVQTGKLKDENLQEVQIWMEQAVLRFPSFFKTHHLISLSSMAQAMRHRYALFGTLPADAALNVYARYDEAYIALRRERSILRGSSSLTARAQVTPFSLASDHYQNAMADCVEALGPPRLQHRSHKIMSHGKPRDPVPTPPPQRSRDELMRELISWAQKRKARSVVEVLGAEIIIPQNSLAALDDTSNGEAIALLRKEADLQIRLKSTPSNPIDLSKELGKVRQEMRECPSLKQVMSFRDGEAITSTELQAMSKELGPRCTMLDFVHLPSSATAIQNDILAMVYKDGILLKSDWVIPDLNYNEIDNWVRTLMIPNDDEPLNNIEPLSTDEALDYLEILAPLIAPAVEVTESGDTILVCPTGVLFNIPFHAIPVEGEPLIKRNPVVYTQSFSILRICNYSAEFLDANLPAGPVAVQALSEAESALPTAPTMAFTSKIGARFLYGSELTKASFLDTMTQSSLIHFYGHVNFDQSKSLDHSMAIRSIDSERITARDIFDNRLRSGAHVNLIGCSSGRSEVRTNDDQFGLSTALLYAGASSILSALWDIRMEDAHEFQEAFYEALVEQACSEDITKGNETGADSSKRMLDLAKVVQTAMLKVSVDQDGNRRAPYHWAAFMLQGYWTALPISSFALKQ